MLVAVRNCLKISALGLAVYGAVSGAALADNSGAIVSALDTPQAQSAVVSSSHAASYTNALKGKSLKVGMTMAPPFAFVTNSLSELQGIDVDIIHELQKRTGFELEGGRAFVMNFDALMSAGNSGQLDVLAGGITLSESREKRYDFSEPYMATSLVLVTLQNTPIRNVSDLNGRRLAAEGGTTATDLFPEADKLNIQMKSSTSAFMSLYDVYAKNADAVVIDRPMVEFYVNNWNDSKLTIVDQVSDESYLGILFKKDAQISRPLQAAYRDMVADGTIERIVNKYVDHKIASK